MRTVMAAGNWKMNNNAAETRAFFGKLESWLASDDTGKRAAAAVKDKKLEIVIAPTFTSIGAAAGSKKSDLIAVSAQNAYFEPKGAFTGEISLPMIEETGCVYVILGHSERRNIFGESDELLEKKLSATLASKLNPIFCVGELIEERTGGKTNDVLTRQLRAAWKNVSASDIASRVVIAYEPVWAIGTGKTASNEDAEDACKFIRGLAEKDFGGDAAQSLRILYGGSVKADNSAGLISQPNIDGFLIGGASVEAESLEKIIASAL
ncbi:triosephosphate isomerase [Synergistales bacterium]|nr:triosephosphate isomerase [Synergistales bacterium]